MHDWLKCPWYINDKVFSKLAITLLQHTMILNAILVLRILG